MWRPAFFLPGAGPVAAVRQVATLFVLSGLLAFAAVPNEPGHVVLLAIIAFADLGIAVVAWLLPWGRWNPGLTALLSLPAFAVLGLSTWTFGGFATGTGPFFVLVFAWLGLHHTPAVILLNAAPATAAYLVPLVAVGSSPRVLSSAIVLIPVALGIGLVVERQVRHLRAERDRAARAEGWRSALMATLAHDIRSPLTSVQGALMLLDESDDIPADRRQSMIRAALKEAKRMTRLATGLLDVERVEQDKLRLDRRWISVTDAATDAASFVATGSDVTVHVDSGLRVYADKERLEQVLVNLIANAVRHGRPPVIVTAEDTDDAVRIHVRDHGPGVPAHRRPGLFDRLGGDSDDAESVGLGMWIVRLLTEAHGGTVSYERVEPGALFTVSLPRGDED